MITDCAVYRDGVRLPGDQPSIQAALEAASGESDMVWMSLTEPPAAELQEVAQALGLPHLAVQDALTAHQRPKLEDFDHGLFVVLKTLRYVEDDDAVRTGEISLFLSRRYVVSVHHGEDHDSAGLRKDLERRASLLGHGYTAVLYAVCDHVADDYEAVAGALADDVDAVEQSVFSEMRSNDAQRIYLLKRELLEFRRAVAPLSDPTARLAGGSVPDIPSDALPFFRRLHDHVVRVSERGEALDTLLSGIYAAYLTRVSVQQNDDMRRISAWVAIAAVPTLLAGIYGMNFEYMPELTWRYGYPLALALMATICLVLYRSFKRSGWL